MRNLFISSFLMNMAIFSNTVIYRLRSLPIIKHIIPSGLYGNEGISAFLTIIMTAIKAMIELSKKIIYIVCILAMLKLVVPGDLNDNFLITMLLFSFIGAIANNRLLQATKEKYYAIVLMRIDANEYGKMDAIKELIINFITFLPVLLIAGLIMHLDMLVCLLLPFYIVSCKCMMNALIIRLYGTKIFTIVESNYFSLVTLFIFLLITAGLLYIQFSIPVYIFVVITFLSILIALFSFKSLMMATSFKPIYKKRLTLNNIIFDASATMAATTKKSLNKKISYNKEFQSKKKGYEYFNEIFTQRHKKILTNSAYKFSAFFLAVIMGTLLLMILYPQLKPNIHTLIMQRIPYFLFIMYFTNRGALITQAMFVNCDSSMLTYRFYRRPEVILGLFKQRLKTVIIVNLIPSLTIAIGLCLWLSVSGGNTSPINYLLIFLCINAMSVFFSVHNLVLYYVLQPYNTNMQARGTLYTIISMVTYTVCYGLMNVRIATFPFTIGVIVFCILYILISLAIAYRQAYKTFKLKN